MAMRKVHFLILALVLAGCTPAIAFSEDVFAPVRKVYMNDGKMIECQMGWLDGARMICRKFGGNMTLPLQNVNFEKTFPKCKTGDGETVLLVHPGPRYQDENVVISNLRMVRGPENQSKNSFVVVCEIINRGNPCEVRVVMNALDAQGKTLRQVEVPSESRLDTGESSILKTRLEGPGASLESQTVSLKVSHVERFNVLEAPPNREKPDYETAASVAGGTQNKARQEKIRLLKEAFLRERPSPP
jgi:hypothetical protein